MRKRLAQFGPLRNCLTLTHLCCEKAAIGESFQSHFSRDPLRMTVVGTRAT